MGKDKGRVEDKIPIWLFQKKNPNMIGRNHLSGNDRGRV